MGPEKFRKAPYSTVVPGATASAPKPNLRPRPPPPGHAHAASGRRLSNNAAAKIPLTVPENISRYIAPGSTDVGAFPPPLIDPDLLANIDMADWIPAGLELEEEWSDCRQ